MGGYKARSNGALERGERPGGMRDLDNNI